MNPKNIFLKLLNQSESHFDSWRLNRRIRKGKLGEVVIFPYCGYGNENKITIRGRVMEHNGLAKPDFNDSTWTNIKAMVRRYMSREIPFVSIKAHFQGSQEIIRADDEGYFHLETSFHAPIDDNRLWHTVNFKLLDELYPETREITGVGEVMIPDKKSHFGVISDIDDTILISKTTHRIEIIRMAMTNNAKTRMPFKGVSAFYNALQKGKDGKQHNPIFYVSSSPWNMYDMLADFFAHNNIPKGPILLRDIGISETKFIKERHASHKLEKIRRILSFYPRLKFLLIGDSGQHDPEIYQQVVEEYPNRVLAIYIRDVSTARRNEEVKLISSQLAKKGVDLIMKQDTSQAATHAEHNGYIQTGSSKIIRRELAKDLTGLS
ncbi:phosphatidate phosphatase APP1 [Catalinimonas alkaloidigena]|uniref:App1 family protein n=1 Tax=Catalinimonas alkaloidigena TaxID=1075417 RepID=UPI00240532F3|nr:phosphatase domain-containing protein [Catalinimonas alkaloidigena]MDF9796831.1 phosphatidate phosphatase APP1 [Catalinimonas alkaloidigena]